MPQPDEHADISVEFNSVLLDPVFRVKNTVGVIDVLTLPGLFSALSRDEVAELVAVRPHQWHTVHMWLAQLMAIAGPVRDQNEDYWLRSLQALTDEPGAWSIFPERGVCGFMQPSMAADISTKTSTSVSDVDLLVLSKNHSVKVETCSQQPLDVWLWHLITLQTGAGFPGRGNYGIFRMNGGFSSRSFWAVYDRSWGVGRRVYEDALLLNSHTEKLVPEYGFNADGLKLMWTAPWSGEDMLTPRDLDIRVIEISRRINLSKRETGEIFAVIGNSLKPRTALANTSSEHFARGYCADIWVPTERGDASKSISMSGRGLSYDQIARNVLCAKISQKTPDIKPAPATQRVIRDPILVAAGIASGQGKTEGLFYRELALGLGSGDMFTDPDIATTSGSMVGEAKRLLSDLRYAFKVFMGRDVPESLENRIIRFADEQIDKEFFKHLLRVNDGAQDAHKNWIETLFNIGKNTMEEIFESVPVKSTERMKKISEATGAYHGSFWSSKKEPSFDTYKNVILRRKDVNDEQ